MEWLLESGSDFCLINSNGHSALHKAAQRGCSGTIKWLVNTFIQHDTNGSASLIAPDNEGNCPSDLCGMEGHESLAQWISKQECNYFMQSILNGKTAGCYSGKVRLPLWLEQELHEVRSHSVSLINNYSQWGTGCGVRRIALNLLKCTDARATSRHIEIEPIKCFEDID